MIKYHIKKLAKATFVKIAFEVCELLVLSKFQSA